MRIKSPAGHWTVYVFRDRAETGSDDNIFLRIHEERAAQSKLFGGDSITIGMTALEAKTLARELESVTGQDSAAEGRKKGKGYSSADSQASSPARPFTKVQGQYLAFIHKYQERFLRSPAESDIQRHFLVSGPTVHQMIDRLAEKGLIERTPGQARSIRLLVPPELLPP